MFVSNTTFVNVSAIIQVSQKIQTKQKQKQNKLVPCVQAHVSNVTTEVMNASKLMGQTGLEW